MRDGLGHQVSVLNQGTEPCQEEQTSVHQALLPPRASVEELGSGRWVNGHPVHPASDGQPIALSLELPVGVTSALMFESST